MAYSNIGDTALVVLVPEADIRATAAPLLPIHAALRTVDLMVFDGERWQTRERFELAR